MTTPRSEEQIADYLQAVNEAAAGDKLTSGAVTNITRWLSSSHYSQYHAGIIALIKEQNFDELDKLFWEVIPFGTGGRRGPMSEFGSATMNSRTIAESAQGLAVYLKQQSSKAEHSGVIACDTRNRSQEFAKLTATTLAANGLKVYYFNSFRSTPELSFAVRHLQCDVGVMLTASHNPPSDNGFKAYWSTGGQVLSPHDKGIIDAVYQAGDIPTVDFDEAVEQGKIVVVGEEVDKAYINAVAAMSLSDCRDISAIFTPLHGVGETSIYKVLQQTGFSDVEIFTPQQEPDGNFTNVPDQLPNPERTEVFQPAIEYASQTDATLILASDPDADRLAICVKNESGKFIHLTGNQTGALLLDYILRKRTDLTPEHFVVETLVTTPLIAAIARKHQLKAVNDLLVGFKYIAETMDALGADKFVFGVEESLGYLAGEYARDKCASIAALYILEAAAELQTAGKTLLDRLDEIYLEQGLYLEGQRSKYCHGSQGSEQIQQLMQTFREQPPATLGDVTLKQVRDYGEHEIRQLPHNSHLQNLPQPEGNLLFFDSAAGNFQCQIAVRPSGTEPKIKFYFFAQAKCSTEATLEEEKEQAHQKFSSLQAALADWVEAALS